MKVFAKRALLLTVLVLCLFGLSILGASAFTATETGVAGADAVASVQVGSDTYYYTDLDNAIKDVAENSDDDGIITVLKDTTAGSYYSPTNASFSLTLQGKEGLATKPKVSFTELYQGAKKPAFRPNSTSESTVLSYSFKDLDIDAASQNLIYLGNGSVFKGEVNVSFDNVYLTWSAGSGVVAFTAGDNANKEKATVTATNSTFEKVGSANTNTLAIFNGNAKATNTDYSVNVENCTFIRTTPTYQVGTTAATFTTVSYTAPATVTVPENAVASVQAPASLNPDDNAGTVTVYYTSLSEAMAYLALGKCEPVLTLLKNVELSETVAVASDLTIVGATADVTISRATGFTGTMFTITGGEFVINNVTVNIGDTTTYGKVFDVSGTASLTIGDADATVATTLTGVMGGQIIHASAAMTGNITLASDATVTVTGVAVAAPAIQISAVVTGDLVLNGDIAIGTAETAVATPEGTAISGLVLQVAASIDDITFAGDIYNNSYYYHTTDAVNKAHNILYFAGPANGFDNTTEIGTVTFSGSITTTGATMLNTRCKSVEKYVIASTADLSISNKYATKSSQYSGFFYFTSSGSYNASELEIQGGAKLTVLDENATAGISIPMIFCQASKGLTVSFTGTTPAILTNNTTGTYSVFIYNQERTVTIKADVLPTITTDKAALAVEDATTSFYCFDSDANAIALYNAAIRMGAAPSAGSTAKYFTSLATAIEAAPESTMSTNPAGESIVTAANTTSLYLIQKYTIPAKITIKNKSIKIVGLTTGTMSAPTTESYDLYTSQNGAFGLAQNAEIIFENVRFYLTRRVFLLAGGGDAREVAEEYISGDEYVRILLVNSYIFTAAGNGIGIYDQNKSMGGTFLFDIDATSTYHGKSSTTSSGTLDILQLNNSTVDAYQSVTINVDGALILESTATDNVKNLRIAVITTPTTEQNNTITFGSTARIVLSYATTPTVSCLIFDTNNNHSVVVNTTNIKLNGSLVTLAQLADTNAISFGSDAVAKSYGMAYRVGTTEGGALGEVYFESLTDALEVAGNDTTKVTLIADTATYANDEAAKEAGMEYRVSATEGGAVGWVYFTDIGDAEALAAASDLDIVYLNGVPLTLQEALDAGAVIRRGPAVTTGVMGVHYFTSLADAVAAAEEDDVLYVLVSFTVAEPITMSGNMTITLEGVANGGVNPTITSTASGALFVIEEATAAQGYERTLNVKNVDFEVVSLVSFATDTAKAVFYIDTVNLNFTCVNVTASGNIFVAFRTTSGTVNLVIDDSVADGTASGESFTWRAGTGNKHLFYKIDGGSTNGSIAFTFDISDIAINACLYYGRNANLGTASRHCTMTNVRLNAVESGARNFCFFGTTKAYLSMTDCQAKTTSSFIYVTNDSPTVVFNAKNCTFESTGSVSNTGLFAGRYTSKYTLSFEGCSLKAPNMAAIFWCGPIDTTVAGRSPITMSITLTDVDLDGKALYADARAAGKTYPINFTATLDNVRNTGATALACNLTDALADSTLTIKNSPSINITVTTGENLTCKLDDATALGLGMVARSAALSSGLAPYNSYYSSYAAAAAAAAANGTIYGIATERVTADTTVTAGQNGVKILNQTGGYLFVVTGGTLTVSNVEVQTTGKFVDISGTASLVLGAKAKIGGDASADALILVSAALTGDITIQSGAELTYNGGNASAIATRMIDVNAAMNGTLTVNGTLNAGTSSSALKAAAASDLIRVNAATTKLVIGGTINAYLASEGNDVALVRVLATVSDGVEITGATVTLDLSNAATDNALLYFATAANDVAVTNSVLAATDSASSAQGFALFYCDAAQSITVTDTILANDTNGGLCSNAITLVNVSLKDDATASAWGVAARVGNTTVGGTGAYAAYLKGYYSTVAAAWNTILAADAEQTMTYTATADVVYYKPATAPDAATYFYVVNDTFYTSKLAIAAELAPAIATIKVRGNVTAFAETKVTFTGKTIVLTSADTANPVTITRAAGDVVDYLFCLTDGANVTFENITINSNGRIVRIGPAAQATPVTFTLGDNAHLVGATNDKQAMIGVVDVVNNYTVYADITIAETASIVRTGGTFEQHWGEGFAIYIWDALVGDITINGTISATIDASTVPAGTDLHLISTYETNLTSSANIYMNGTVSLTVTNASASAEYTLFNFHSAGIALYIAKDAVLELNTGLTDQSAVNTVGSIAFEIRNNPTDTAAFASSLGITFVAYLEGTDSLQYFATLGAALAAAPAGSASAPTVVYLVNNVTVTEETTVNLADKYVKLQSSDGNVFIVTSQLGAGKYVFTIMGNGSIEFENIILKGNSGILNIGAFTGSITLGANAEMALDAGEYNAETFLIKISGAFDGTLNIYGDMTLGNADVNVGMGGTTPYATATGNATIGFLLVTADSPNATINVAKASGDTVYNGLKANVASQSSAMQFMIAIANRIKALNLDGTFTMNAANATQAMGMIIVIEGRVTDGITVNGTMTLTATGAAAYMLVIADSQTTVTFNSSAVLTMSNEDYVGENSAIIATASDVIVNGATLKVDTTDVAGDATVDSFPVIILFEEFGVDVTISGNAQLINNTAGEYAYIVYANVANTYAYTVKISGTPAFTTANTALGMFAGTLGGYGIDLTSCNSFTLNGTPVVASGFDAYATAQGMKLSVQGAKIYATSFEAVINMAPNGTSTAPTVILVLGDMTISVENTVVLESKNIKIMSAGNTAFTITNGLAAGKYLFNVSGEGTFYLDNLVITGAGGILKLDTFKGNVTIGRDADLTVTGSGATSYKMITVAGAITGRISVYGDLTMDVTPVSFTGTIADGDYTYISYVIGGTATVSQGYHLYGNISARYRNTGASNNVLSTVRNISSSSIYVYSGEIKQQADSENTQSSSALIYTDGAVSIEGGTLKIEGAHSGGPVIWMHLSGNLNVTGTVSSPVSISTTAVNANTLSMGAYNGLFVLRTATQGIYIEGNVTLSCANPDNVICLNNRGGNISIEGATIEIAAGSKFFSNYLPEQHILKNVKIVGGDAVAKTIGVYVRTSNTESAYYSRLQDAVDAVANNGTVYIIESFTQGTQITITNKDLTIASAGTRATITNGTTTWLFDIEGGSAIKLQNIDIDAVGRGFRFNGSTASANPAALTLVNANIYAVATGTDASGIVTVQNSTQAIIVYFDLKVDASSSIGYNTGAATEDMHAIWYDVCVNDGTSAYAKVSGGIEIEGRIFGTATNATTDQHLIYLNTYFKGTLKLTGTIEHTVAFATASDAVALWINNLNCDTTVLDIDGWVFIKDDAIVTTYAGASTSDKFVLSAQAGASFVYRDADDTGWFYFCRFLNTFASIKHDTTVYLLKNVSGGYSGNVAKAAISGVSIAISGDNPFTTAVERAKLSRSGFPTNETTAVPYLFILTNGADLTLVHLEIATNGAGIVIQNTNSEDPSNVVLGEKLYLHGCATREAMVAVSGDTATTAIYANLTIADGAIVAFDSSTYNGRDAAMIYALSKWVGNITVEEGATLKMSFSTSATTNQRMFATGTGASFNGDITIAGDILYNMTFTAYTGAVTAFDISGDGQLIFEETANVTFYTKGNDTASSAFFKLASSASSQLDLVVKGGYFDFQTGYGFWITDPYFGINFNFYDGLFEAKESAIIRLDGNATVNVYGGTYNYMGTLNGASPILINKGKINVEGGIFRTVSTVSPVFFNAGSSATMNLNSFVAVGNANLTNKIFTPDFAKYGRWAHQTFNVTTGATPNFDKFGLGFKATLTEAEYARLVALADLDDGDVTTLKFGMLYVKASDLDEEDYAYFTHAGLKHLNVAYTSLTEGNNADDNVTVTTASDGCKEIRAVIANIDSADYTTAYAVIFFATYEKNGNTVTVYSNYDAAKNTRSLAQVALSAYNDTIAEQRANEEIYTEAVTVGGNTVYSPYTEPQRTQLETWCGGNTELKSMDLYLIAGGSNAAGMTSHSEHFIDSLPTYDFSNIFYSGVTSANMLQTNGGTNVRYLAQNYVPSGSAVTPNRGWLGWSSDVMGAELGMAIALSEQYNSTTNRSAAIVKFSLNDSSISEWAVGSDNYESFLTMVAEEFSNYRRMGYDVNIAGMYWMQGEVDVASTATYKAAFEALVAGFNADFAEIDEDLASKKLPINVGELSAYEPTGLPNAAADLIAVQQSLAYVADPVSGVEGVTVTNSSLFASNNGIFTDAADVLFNGRVVAAQLMKAALDGSIQIPEIEAFFGLFVNDQPYAPNGTALVFRSLIAAFAQAKAYEQKGVEGIVIGMLDDYTIYETLTLEGVDGLVLDGRGNELLVSNEGAAIALNNATVELRNITITQDNGSAVITAGDNVNLTIAGGAVLTAKNIVVDMLGANSNLTVKDATTKLVNTTGEATTDALIHTVGANVMIEGGIFNAVGASTAILLDAAAPEKLVVAVKAGTFTTAGTVTFTNAEKLAVLVVLSNGTVTVNGTALTGAATESTSFSNAGYGNFGLYNNIVDLPEFEDVPTANP